VRPASGREAFVALTQLVHRYRRFPFEDPVLPAALLPEGWVGAEAARVYSALVKLWDAAAFDFWRGLIRS
jgi:phenylacetic acid degradation operon negative regulatory protein